MNNTEKIRELIFLIEEEAESEYPNRDRILDACKWLKKALSLLPPPCKFKATFGAGMPEIHGAIGEPVPDCQAPVGESENPHYENWVYHPKDTKKLKDFIKKEKAPAGEVGEFAKKIEEEIKYVDKFNDILWLAKNLKQACTHLTTLLKQIAEQYDKGWRDGSDAQDKADHEHIIKPLQAKNRKLKNQKEYVYKPEIAVLKDEVDKLRGITHGDSAIAIIERLEGDLKDAAEIRKGIIACNKLTADANHRCIEQLEEGAYAANEEAQIRNDQIKQLEGEKGMLEEQFRQPHKCMGCDEKIYYQSCCKRCNRQWQS